MAAPPTTAIGASHTRPVLTRPEYLAMLLKAPWIVATVTYVYARQLFLRQDWSLGGLQVACIVAIGRIVPTRLSIRQLHYLNATTGDTALAYCKAHKLTHSSILLDAGSGFPPGRLHFLGTRPAFAPTDPSRRILLYIHGGGFVFPASKGHCAFAVLAARAANAELAMLEYTVTPGTPYAAQVAQAVVALQHLIDERGFKPGQIIVGGDSAGARIILSLLSHFKVPRPGVPQVAVGSTDGSKLRGVLLMSPGCTHDQTSPNFAANEKRDVLSLRSVNIYSQVFRAASGDAAASSLAANATHWGDLATDEILVTAGRQELLYDGIVKLAELLQASTDPTAKKRLQVYEREIHAQAILEATMGNLSGRGTSEMLAWLSTL